MREIIFLNESSEKSNERKWRKALATLKYLSNKTIDKFFDEYYANDKETLANVKKLSRKLKIEKLKSIARDLPESYKEDIINSKEVAKAAAMIGSGGALIYTGAAAANIAVNNSKVGRLKDSYVKSAVEKGIDPNVCTGGFNPNPHPHDGGIFCGHIHTELEAGFKNIGIVAADIIISVATMLLSKMVLRGKYLLKKTLDAK